ncbi:MAG: hypothetical protein AAGF73_12845 [Actinomycetota bacterium]
MDSALRRLRIAVRPGGSTPVPTRLQRIHDLLGNRVDTMLSACVNHVEVTLDASGRPRANAYLFVRESAVPAVSAR